MTDEMRLRSILQRLIDAHEQTFLYQDNTPISPQAAFAIGEAGGALSKAIALVSRDIEQLPKQPKTQVYTRSWFDADPVIASSPSATVAYAAFARMPGLVKLTIETDV